MLYILVALAVGLVIGLARGGRLAAIGDVSFRLTPLLVAGVVGQAVSAAVGGGIGVGLLLASYAALLAFALANLGAAGVGMAVVAIGIAMNGLVIAANGSMPVRREAIVAAGIAADEEIGDIDFGSKRHLEEPGDRLTFLGDIVPVPVLEEVLSFGDLVLAVGVADVVVALMGPRRRRETGWPTSTPDRRGTG